MSDHKEDYKHDAAHVEVASQFDDAEIARAKAQHVADTAADGYVDPTLIISPEENNALRKKINRRVLPLLCLAYICQALDKGTLGTASIMGWQADVGAVGQDYALTSTFLWVGIIVGEPIANQLVRRLPLGKLIGIAIIIWSALLLGLAFSLSIIPVFVIRALLGFSESVVGPVLLSITVQWYLKVEQPFVSACWQAMLGAQSAIGGLLGFGFYHVQKTHGLFGWQWMTIAIALFSFVAGTVILLFLPDSPTQARWATEDEKVKFVERVRSNNQGIKQKHFRRDQLVEAFTDPYTLVLFGLAFTQTLVVGGINTFNNLLMNKAFGFTVLQSQLLNIPLGAMTILTYFLITGLIKRFNQTLLIMMAFTIPNIIGSIVLLTVTPSDKTKGGLVVAFYIMQVFQSCNPAIFLMLSRNVAGQTKKSILYAVTYIGWAGGNSAAPQLFQAKWAPRYLRSLEIHLALYGCFIIICCLGRMLLVSRNKKKEAAQQGHEPTNMLAFDDLTDIQNPDFRYCL